VSTLLLRNAARLSRGRREVSLMRAASLGVYELDDGLPWDDGRLPGLGRWWKRPWPRSLIARRAAAAADRVIVGNEVLADWASDWCDDVRLIPTCVEPDDYLPVKTYEVQGAPVIGWLGGPATETYLSDLLPVLDAVHRSTGAIVEVVSSRRGTVVAPFVRRRPWSEVSERESMCGWTLGIMPLRDGVYERAKCGYKLLQYGSAGLPVIGSPIGVNRQILESMQAPAPTTDDAWRTSIEAMLAADASDRARAGAAARLVAQEYSYGSWEQAWCDAVGLPPP
jgi:hypothetical protein